MSNDCSFLVEEGSEGAHMFVLGCSLGELIRITSMNHTAFSSSCTYKKATENNLWFCRLKLWAFRLISSTFFFLQCLIVYPWLTRNLFCKPRWPCTDSDPLPLLHLSFCAALCTCMLQASRLASFWLPCCLHLLRDHRCLLPHLAFCVSPRDWNWVARLVWWALLTHELSRLLCEFVVVWF